MVLTIMNLEAQLLEEIKVAQEKLDKVRGVSPKLQALESLLQDCYSTCEEFGMVDLFTSLLGNFTGTVQTQTTITAPQVNPTPTANTALTDKEVKAIRAELKEFLEYEGQRLNDKTAKELLIKKLEDLNRTDLLTTVNLDDKENFLVEAKKLIALISTPNVINDATVEEIKTTLTPTQEEVNPSVNDGVKTLTPATTPTEEVKEEVKEEGLNPRDAVKSALVQNVLNGYYGTVEQDGVIANVQNEECACVRYPNTTELTPLINLKLISPAIINPTPLNTPVEEIKEEVSTEEEEEIKDMTPQERMMWDALLSADFTPEELTALSTDKETVDGYNSTNGTNLTSLPIAELYEYTMGVGRIE